MIDRHTIKNGMIVWNELTTTSSKSKGFKVMTGVLEMEDIQVYHLQ